jgi:hypothetical protein
MYDSVDASQIPVDAVMVAGYIDGRYAWSAADWARFPHAVHVEIAVRSATNAGHVLDVETGDATPAEAPGWVLMRRKAGCDPSVYCSTSRWPEVVAAFAAAHVPNPHYWVAAYPGMGAVIPSGAVAHQYADPGHFDLSVVADYWPGVDVPPITHPEVPPMPRTALPAAALPAHVRTAVWNPAGTQWDVTLDGADGHCYHIWYLAGLNTWNGYDDLVIAASP